MFVVHFFENKNLLLTQYLKQIPSLEEELKIKGRKGTVSSVTKVDERHIHVQLILETLKKKKLVLDLSKKKKR